MLKQVSFGPWALGPLLMYIQLSFVSTLEGRSCSAGVQCVSSTFWSLLIFCISASPSGSQAASLKGLHSAPPCVFVCSTFCPVASLFTQIESQGSKATGGTTMTRSYMFFLPVGDFRVELSWNQGSVLSSSTSVKSCSPPHTRKYITWLPEDKRWACFCWLTCLQYF